MTLDYMDRLAIDLPEKEIDGVSIKHFEVEEHDFQNLRYAMSGRGTRPGKYTMITANGRLWMSDTDAEKRDHAAIVIAMRQWEAKRVIINGLGLGCVVAAALSYDHVEHVDVVEKDKRVIDLVGPTYTASGRVTIHHADAFEQAKAWPKGTRWDVGWSDIWENMCADDLAEHAILNRSYGRRCNWHQCWAHDLLVEYRRRENHRWGY